MKKLTKIILLLLALSLTLAVPFTVSASEIEPSLKIEAANLSFEDSVYPVFAVSSKDVDASSIKLLVWTSPKTSESEYIKGTEAAELTSYADETIDGVPCKKFKYTKLYAKNMTDDIYVRAYAELDGEAVYSDTVKYSVLKYAYNKLGYTGTESQSASFKKLLNATLAQGAAAQEYFEYKIDRLADARYYQISVEGGYLADGTTSGLFLAGEQVVLTAPATDANGRPFVAWLDELGVEVATDASATITVAKENATYTASYEPKEDVGAGVEALAYTVNAGGTTCTITGIGECAETVIYIPEYMGEYKVTAIGEKAFENCADVTYIKIPDTVTTIGKRAFYGCTGLTEMTIPASVTSIGTQIFYKASNLSTVYYNSTYSSSENTFLNNGSITKIVFGERYVPDYICYNNASVKTVEILDSVTSIGERAFYKCTSLTSVVIGDGVTSIGYEAFYGCTSLTSIAIPDSVTSIGACAFYNCASPKDVYYTGSIEDWCNIAFSDSGSNPMYYGANLYINGTLVTTIVIPDTVTKIDYAFEGCTSLTSIVIPDSVKSIGDSVFSGCTSLTSIVIPDSVTNIGDGAFSNCTSLTSIEIPDSVTSIGNYAFSDCTSLTSIEIPDSVTSIGSFAFDGCTSLTSIVIPDSVTSIGYGAFRGCTSLTSIEIPDSVTSIDSYAFSGCTSLTSIAIPDSVTSIGSSAFSNCTSLTSIVIPDSVTSIGYDAFRGCSSLKDVYYTGTEEQWGDISIGSDNAPLTNATIHYNYGKEPVGTEGLEYELQSDDTYAVVDYTGTATEVVIPSTYEGKAVTSIVQRAFYENVDITNVSIPDSITIIGDYAFYGCTSIESITIPESVTYIGPKAINSCKEIVWNFSGFSKWEVYIPSIVGKDPYESYQTKTLTNLRLIITIASDPAYVNYANKCLRNTVTVDSGVDYNVAGHDYRITLCYGNYALTRVS